jgi:hypothetical protein
MAELEILGDNLAQVNGDFTTTVVTLLDNIILLRYCDELSGMSYTQTFTCLLSNILDKKAMKDLFYTRNRMKDAALEHTKGRTNKVAFSYNLRKLKENKRISESTHDLLSEIIKDSTCPPIKLFERLTRLGYGDILVALDFYEEDPLLTRSILEFEQFISLLPEE